MSEGEVKVTEIKVPAEKPVDNQEAESGAKRQGDGDPAPADPAE